jgi:hypothetical protein
MKLYIRVLKIIRTVVNVVSIGRSPFVDALDGIITTAIKSTTPPSKSGQPYNK